MSLGNLGWNNLLLGINGGVNNPTLFRNEENEESKLMQKIPTGLRLTQEGHLTNAPETMGEGEYAHGIIYYNRAKQALTVEFDERWKEICPDVRATIGSIEFTTVESKADEITNGSAVDGYGQYTCSEDYELRDGMCQLGATDRLKNTVVEKAGVGVLIIASAIGLKFFLGK